ncbi:MAG TPA: M14 family zinc carboxypeptidase [Chthoniobacteraceae bacterium]|jgi:hypothetical protein
MHGSKTFRRSIGRSVEGREQVVQANFNLETDLPQQRGTLLIGGMHGDEVATIKLLESFAETYLAQLAEPVAMVALCNPDGEVRNSRYNARGVDLNRNCDFAWDAESVEPSGAGPWSEPEICALRDFIIAMAPAKIVSLHWALAEIDADGPQSTPLAQAMWQAMSEAERAPYRLRVTELGRGKRRLQQTYTICPGSLGQWCGYGLKYAEGSSPAMITLELPYDPLATSRPDPLPDDHLAALHERWRDDRTGYLTAVEPAVHRMLLAACRYTA